MTGREMESTADFKRNLKIPCLFSVLARDLLSMFACQQKNGVHSMFASAITSSSPSLVLLVYFRVEILLAFKFSYKEPLLQSET
jgi:hypothetical protein